MLTPGSKVLLFAEYGRMGGTRTYFKQLLALYKKCDLAVTVVRTYVDDDQEIDDLVDAYGFDSVDAVDIAQNGVGLWGKFPFCALYERYAYRHFVRSLRPKVLVASVGTPGLFAGVLGLARHSIYILHTYPHDQGATHHWKAYLRRLIYRYALLGHTRTLTVSEHSKERISHAWGLTGDREPIVVYSTVGEIAQRMRGEPAYRIILTVGHVAEYKNPYVWLEVAMNVINASERKDVRFVWVGEGELLDACRRAVVDRGMERYVFFAGLSNDVEPFYRDCTIYFQPSLVESLGLGVLDALRHGIPCVVSNRGGLPEVVKDSECGWVVEPNDIDAIAGKLTDLLNHDVRYAQMSASAARRYHEVFAPSIWEERMIGIHASAMETL